MHIPARSWNNFNSRQDAALDSCNGLIGGSKQVVVVPNVDWSVLANKESPSGRKRQELYDSRANVDEMENVKWLKKVGSVREIAAPYVPATCVTVRPMAEAVERVEVQRCEGDAHLGLAVRWLRRDAVSAADAL